MDVDVDRILIGWTRCRWAWFAKLADNTLFRRRFRLVQEVLREGSVRDLERLEHCYFTAGLPEWGKYLRRATGGNYAHYVLTRESVAWQLKIR